MNAPSKMTRKGKLFKSNRSQAVRIPKDLAFPENVKDILIRRVGNKIEITPSDSFWEDFFSRPPCPDFPDRAPQGDYEGRESFDL